MQPGSLLAIGDAAAILEEIVSDKGGKQKQKLPALRRTMDFGRHKDAESSSTSTERTSASASSSSTVQQQQQPRRAPLPATAQVFQGVRTFGVCS